MTKEQVFKFAALMAKAYNWLLIFKRNNPSFVFTLAEKSTKKSGGQLLFPREHQNFYVVLYQSPNQEEMLELRFYPNQDMLGFKKVTCRAKWGVKTDDHHPFHQFAAELNASVQEQATSKKFEKPISESSDQTVMREEICNWLSEHLDALKEALNGKQLSLDGFDQMEQRRLVELCDGGWLKRSDDGSYVVPETANFRKSDGPEGNDDTVGASDKDDVVFKKLKIDLKEFLYNALKDKYQDYLCSPENGLQKTHDYFRIAGTSGQEELSVSLADDVHLTFYSLGRRNDLRKQLGLPIAVEEDTNQIIEGLKVEVPSKNSGRVFYVKTGVELSSLRNPESEVVKKDAMTKIAEKTGEVLGVLISKGAISPRSRGEKTAGDSNGEKREQDDMVSRLVEMVEASKNVVLTGAPGTGKTYTAREVAKVMVGAMVSKDAPEDEKEKAKKTEEERIASIQFHPGYDYSDFVIGMKPVLVSKGGKEVFRDGQGLFTTDNNKKDGTREEFKGETDVSFFWKDGVFKEFVVKAREAYDAVNGKEPPKFVFLIDEINRADLSRVFGELFSLLEEDYRYFIDNHEKRHNEKGITLPNSEPFVIPKNLYIIGTMNDIDRSVESMDFALRRRFAWYEVRAKDTMDAILRTTNDDGSPKIKSADELIAKMKALNKVISGEEELEYKTKEGVSAKINMRSFLGTAYELGAAIFAKFSKSGSFDVLWENHIKTILSEYLRGRRDSDVLLGALKEVYDKANENNDNPPKIAESSRVPAVANS